jgi:hypothetical protein
MAWGGRCSVRGVVMVIFRAAFEGVSSDLLLTAVFIALVLQGFDFLLQIF